MQKSNKKILSESLNLPIPNAFEEIISENLFKLLSDKIEQNNNWLSFANFMETVLYEPNLGYYCNNKKKIGLFSQDGSDFITAPELTPIFAQTLARPIVEIMQQSQTSEIIEFGAGTGAMAAELLLTLDQLGQACDRYTIVDLSGSLHVTQSETIKRLAPDLYKKVHWCQSLPKHFAGVVIGNEVLDAMPVKLFAYKNNAWYERGITSKFNNLVGPISNQMDGIDPINNPFLSLFDWQDRLLSHEERQNTLLLSSLPSHIVSSIENEALFITETHEIAAAFIKTVTSMLTRGAAIFIDYGFSAHEYYHPQRNQGTLMCHYRHYSHANPLCLLGLQDITAHLNFSVLAQTAEDAGADLLGYCSQARFLLNAGLADIINQTDINRKLEYLSISNRVQKLISEAEMGELFKVLAFSKGIRDMPAAFATGNRIDSLFYDE